MKPSWIAPLCTLATGVATLGILVGFSQLAEVKAAYPAGDFTDALGAFQRATSMDQLTTLFGDPPDAGKLAAMTAGNTLDLHAFIPVYTIFLIWGALMLGQNADGKGRALQWFPLIAVLIGCAGDIVETSAQIAVSSDYAHAAAALPRVAPGCWTKFFGLAVHALGCSALCLTGVCKRWILGVLGLLPIVGTAGNYFHALQASAMSATFAVFWVGLLVAAAVELFRVTRMAPATSAVV
ncbi:MAG: hypothetical protein QM759_14820 [Terricaulis sp.]